MRHARLQLRLLMILAAAATAVTVGSAVALLAMIDIGREFQAVTRSELPETTAALRMARIGERIQSRAPALVAAFDADERAEQARLIETDLTALSGELAALTPLLAREPESMDRITGTIADLGANLRDISGYLARKDALERARGRLLDRVLTLEGEARQILGPSILAVQSVVDRDAGPAPTAVGDIRADAVRAQGPLLEGERLVGSLTSGFFVVAEADAQPRVTALSGRSARQIARLEDAVAAMPSGLRPDMAALTDRLSEVLDPETGLFAVRAEELEALQAAERLLARNRALTDRLSRDVDSVVQAANAGIRAAAGRVQETIVDHSVGFVLFSIAAVLIAAALSWFFIIRDVGLNLRRVTEAMSRLAAGERSVAVPAMHRRDEIGALARAFDVFRDNVLRIERLDRQLAEKSSLLVATFDNMNDGFTVFDEDARLIAWNPQYLRLYDLPAELVEVGRPLGDLLGWVEAQGARAIAGRGDPVPLAAVGEERRSQSRRFEMHLVDGRIVELRSNPVPHGGFVTIHTDVTEQKAIESQLRQAQKMEVIGQLSGGLAHDFNNILGVILGNLHVLDDGLINRPDLRERATRALGAAERAGQQIERLLAVSRRLKLSPERLDVNDLISGMLDLLEASVGSDITLNADLAPNLPAVIVDPGQLENSLLNLVVNARDALTAGGTITVATGTEGGTAGAPARVTIAVADTGPGIPAELIERVFEPFFTTKSTGRGSGLGLSMVYGFVTQSGGTVRIDSAPERGATVTLALPAAPPVEADAVEPSGEPAGPGAGPALAPGHAGPVLVVDDEPAVRETIAADLRDHGYAVREAPDAEAAMALLRGGLRPGLLFSDVFLGDGEDGFELARRARGLLPGLPVLLSSGGPADRMTRLASDGPDLEVLRKPVAADTLATAIRRTLAAQGRSTSASKT